MKRVNEVTHEDASSDVSNKKRRIPESSANDADGDNDSGVDLPPSEPDLEAMRAQIEDGVRARLEQELEAKYKIQVSPPS